MTTEWILIIHLYTSEYPVRTIDTQFQTSFQTHQACSAVGHYITSHGIEGDTGKIGNITFDPSDQYFSCQQHNG